MASRLLSPLNQAYRNLAMLTSANSCEWITLEAPLDPQRLAAAARALVRCHPVLNSVQVRRALLFHAWRPLDTPIEVDIRHERLTDGDEASIHARLVDNIHREPLDLTRSRPLRLHHTTLPDGRAVLQIITTHVFTDGRSANLAARDLARAYADPQSLQAVPPPVERDPFRLFTRHLPWGQRWRLGWQGLRAIFADMTRPVTSLRLSDHPRGPTRVDFVDYGRVGWARLQHGARERGYSVHPFILAAVLRVVERLNARRGAESPVIRVIDNFSLRRFASPPAAVAELYDVLAVPYTVDYTMSRDSATLLDHIRGQLDRLKAGGILAELYRQWHYRNSGLLSDKRLGTWLVTRHVMRSNVICTNIGPVPEEFDTFGPVAVQDYYSFSQMFPPGQLMFLFSTWRGRLRLVLLHDGNNLDARTAREICDELFPAELDRALRETAPPAFTESAPTVNEEATIP